MNGGSIALSAHHTVEGSDAAGPGWAISDWGFLMYMYCTSPLETNIWAMNSWRVGVEMYVIKAEFIRVQKGITLNSQE